MQCQCDFKCVFLSSGTEPGSSGFIVFLTLAWVVFCSKPQLRSAVGNPFIISVSNWLIHLAREQQGDTELHKALRVVVVI